MMKLTLLLTLVPMFTFAMDPCSPERLAALSMIETGNNDHMVGRAGEISRYQIIKKEWHSVTNSRNYTDRETARAVTQKLMDKRVQNFESSFRRPPTDFELYGLWNAPGQVMQGRMSARVAERCQRYVNLCAVFQPRFQTANLSRRSNALVF
jgi:hypothetical protein